MPTEDGDRLERDSEAPAVAAEHETDQPRADQGDRDEAAPKARKRRRGRKPATGADAQIDVQAETGPDSSPMVERPLAEEPPITATEAPEEPFEEPKPIEAEGPKARRRPRARKADAAATGVPQTPAPEPEPKPEPEPEPGPVPTKPVRKRGSKAAAAEPARQRAEPSPARESATASAVPTPDNDSAMSDAEGTDADGEPRRGWWQRTFG
jgi:ribonuclease E